MGKSWHARKKCMRKHAASSYSKRTNNVRQSYGSPTNSYRSYDSRKKVLQIRTAAVRIRSLCTHLQFCRARTTVVRRSYEHRTAGVRSLWIVLRRYDLPAIGLRFRSYEFARKNISHGWCKQGFTRLIKVVEVYSVSSINNRAHTNTLGESAVSQSIEQEPRMRSQTLVY